MNVRGLGGKPKILSLNRLLESNFLDIVLLQETMGCVDTIIKNIKEYVKGWQFVSLDYFGSSRGLITSLWEILSLSYSFEVPSGLVIFVHNRELDSYFHILNLYKPYNDRE
jgi:hypothetical protein